MELLEDNGDFKVHHRKGFFPFSPEQTYTLEMVEGVVITSGGKFSETNISSTSNHRNVISSVSSQTTTNQDIWIKDNSGKEILVQLFDSDAAVREGQELSLFKIGSEWIFLINHTTSEGWRLCSSHFFSRKDSFGFFSRVIPLGIGASFLISEIVRRYFTVGVFASSLIMAAVAAAIMIKWNVMRFEDSATRAMPEILNKLRIGVLKKGFNKQ